MSTPPTGRALSWIVRVSTARPRAVIALCLALAVVSGIYTARRLTFEASAVQLLPPDRVYVQRFKAALREFGELNDIVVVVGAPTIARAKDFADQLSARIAALPGAGRVTHRIDPALFKGQALLYLSRDRIAELGDKIAQHREFVKQYASRPTLDQLISSIAEEIGRRFALGFIDLGLAAGTPERFDPGFVRTLVDAVADGIDGSAVGSPWSGVFEGGDDARPGYFLSGDKKLLFIFVEPRRDATSFTDNEHFIADIRRAIGALRQQHPDVAAGVTGAPALSNDEMVTAFRDSAGATTLALAVTLGLLLLVFRRAVEPLVMSAVLLVSLVWSLGLITATVGHLTVFSVMFISLLIGIGIDYGIYLFFRYEEEVGLGREPHEALRIAGAQTGPGILFGALTAAGTFGVLALTEFRGIREFGFIAALSILVAFAAMMTLFPAALMTLRRRAVERVRAAPSAARAAHERSPALERLLRRPAPILVCAGALAAYSLAAIPAVRFDYNRLNLQARGTESVVWERRIRESARSGFPALTTAASFAELRDKQAAFERLPGVSDVMSVLTLIPRDQAAKIAAIGEIAPLLSTVRPGRVTTAPDMPRLASALGTLRDRLALGMREADPGPTVDTLRAAHGRVEALLARLAAGEGGLGPRIARVQADLGDDFLAKLERLRENLAPRPVTVDEVPAEVKRKFIGWTGQYLLQIYPATDTWDRDGARQFVSELRSVDPAITGSPVISYEASRLMEQAYLQGTLCALALVGALIAIVLRRPLDVALALIPLTLGTLWTIGFMHAFGLTFNLANVWGLPLIIGAAAEYGLNVALRYGEIATRGREFLPRSTVQSVLLNGLTTIAGFGSLMVARHQGIFGLGLLLTVGAATGIASALLVLPVLLRALRPVALATRQPDPTTRQVPE